jgi:hypothetical protein
MGSKTKTFTQDKLTGTVYTPIEIVKLILDRCGYKGETILGKTILDPSCGDGRFLCEIVARIIKSSPKKDLKKNLGCIYGWEIQKDALDKCRANLDSLVEPLGLKIKWNLELGDALRHIEDNRSLFGQKMVFDFIVGNPPYIRIQHLDEKTRAYIQTNYSLCETGSTDIYVAFFELAISLLSDNGVCGYITPNTYLFTATAARLRDHFRQGSNLIELINYGALQLFDDATTYSAVTIFGGQRSRTFTFKKAVTKTSFNEVEVCFSDLPPNGASWKLDGANGVIQANPPGSRPLGDICDIRVGLATLCDKAFIFRTKNGPAGISIAHTKLCGDVELENDLLLPVIKCSTAKDCGKLPEYRLLFPYKKNAAGKHTIIPEAELRKNWPLSYAYLKRVRPELDKRDNGRPNETAWYAFGRSQALDICQGEKIVFSPMNSKPLFLVSRHPECFVYSGYFIKYGGNLEALAEELNSERMVQFINTAGKDMLGGWKGYSKKTIESFPSYLPPGKIL